MDLTQELDLQHQVIDNFVKRMASFTPHLIQDRI